MTDADGEVQDVQCVFLVVIDNDGGSRVVIRTDEHFVPRRMATPKDIYPALSNILGDFDAMKHAEAVVALQTSMARQRMAQEEIRQEVSEGYGD